MVWRLHSLHLSRGLQKRNLYLVLAGDLGYSISKLLTVASSDNINTLRKREKKRNDHNKLKYLIIWFWSWDFFCVIVDEGKASLGLSLCSQYIICSKSQWVCRYAQSIYHMLNHTHILIGSCLWSIGGQMYTCKWCPQWQVFATLLYKTSTLVSMLPIGSVY